MVHEIETAEQLQHFLGLKGKKLLFKHSTQCPISAGAHKQFLSFVADNGGGEWESDLPAALVKVIEFRPVSNAIAEQFGIKHESPQIFVLDGEVVVWHTSHRNIRKEAIAEHVGV